jgi:hypothetical protein
MTRLSYTKALDHLLQPLGFAREEEKKGKDWIRIRGDVWDCVNLQKSWVDGGVTVNLYAKDLETEKVLKSIACNTVLGVHLAYERIGILIDGYDRWWKNNPDGPAELAEAVRVHGVPWFDRVQSLEDQATFWYYRTATAAPWRRSDLTTLAVTLFRLGALDEALALFEAPVPRTAMHKLVAEGRCVQRWLKNQKRDT